MDPAVSAALDELRSLVAAVMHASSGSQEQRAAAERRLLAIQKDESRWRLHLQVLYAAESDVVFFLAQGLRQFVWSHWRELSAVDKEFLTRGVVECIRRPAELTVYGRSKLEQILSSICVMSGSLDPVLGLVVEAPQPGVELGASALRTVLEEVLGEDSKVSSDQRKALVATALNVAVPAAALACQICDGVRASGAADSPLLMTAVDLLRVLVGKLPIGPHLNASVLHTLCSLAERAIYIDENTRRYAATTRSSGGPSCRNESYAKSAVAALGVLNELMAKRYVPRSVGGDGVSAGELLLELVATIVGLVQRFRPVCNHPDNLDVISSLVTLLSAFVTSGHLEKALDHANKDASLSTVLSAFVDEFAGVTAALVEPELLLGCCEIWQGLLEIDSLRRVVLSSPSSLQAAMHILKSSLTFENPELETISEDMCADIAPSSAEIVAVTDVALRELTGTPVKFQDIYGSGASSSSSSSRDEDGGRVEATASLGTCLTRAADLCIGHFLESKQFRAELATMVPDMLDGCINRFLHAYSTIVKHLLSCLPSGALSSVAGPQLIGLMDRGSPSGALPLQLLCDASTCLLVASASEHGSVISGAVRSQCSDELEEINNALLDALFLLRLFPVCGSPEVVLDKLTNILVYMVFSNASAVLGEVSLPLVACTVQTMQLLGSIGAGCRRGGLTEGQFAVVSTLETACAPAAAACLARCLIPCSSGSSTGGSAGDLGSNASYAGLIPEPVQVASAALLLQLVIGLPTTSLTASVSIHPTIGQVLQSNDSAFRALPQELGALIGTAPNLGTLLLSSIEYLISSSGTTYMPIPVNSLLFCAATRLRPDIVQTLTQSVAQMCASVAVTTPSSASQFACSLTTSTGASMAIDALPFTDIPSIWTRDAVWHLNKTLTGLGAMTRQYGGTDAQTRHSVLPYLSVLEAGLCTLTVSTCNAIMGVYHKYASAVVSEGPQSASATALRFALNAYVATAANLLYTAIGLLKSFGRKAFGHATSTVLAAFSRLMACSDLNIRSVMSHNVSGRLVSGIGSALNLDSNECTKLERVLVHKKSSSVGIVYLKQLIAAVNALSSTPASTSQELVVSHSVLARLSAELSDSVMCSEMLPELIRCGWALVEAHWPQTGSSRARRLQPPSEADRRAYEEGLQRVAPTLALMLDLFVGCLSTSTVAPQDAVLSIEGIVNSNNKLGFMQNDWFQSSNYIAIVLEAVIKALLNNTLPAHSDSLDALLQAVLAFTHNHSSIAGNAPLISKEVVWQAFKDIVIRVSVSSNCSADSISSLISEEESKALQRAQQKAYILHQATSPTLGSPVAPEQLKIDIDIFDAMKCVIGVVTAEISRRNEFMTSGK